MRKINELVHKFSDNAGDAVIDKVLAQLEHAIELKDQGKDDEADKVVNDLKAWLDDSIQQLENCTKEDEIEIERAMLPKYGEIIAEGDRIRLGVVREDEKEKYLAVSYEYSFMKSAFKDKKFLENLWDEFLSETAFVCSIYEKESGRYVGYCSVKSLRKDDWELAIELIPSECHKGYGSEALTLLMRTLHELTGKRFFCARVELDNHPSQGLMKKIGGHPDGVSEFLLHGEDIDKFREEYKDQITDEIRAVAEDFCMDAEDMLGYVLRYRFDMMDRQS